MKKLLTYILLLCLLCGCAPFGSNTYVVVEPHDEGYEVAIDSNAVTVSSYLGLKNAITDMVEECVTDGVIRAEGYTGEITEDLSSAVYEVWRGDPLGAFAVDYMTYDCSKIVSYYEIHIHTTYRRTQEEIESVEYASGLSGLRDKIREAMETYEPVVRIRVSDYQEVDYEELVLELFQEHPEFALEQPEITVTSYPETGSQRILEIGFAYDLPQEQLLAMKQQANEQLEYIVKLYGSNNDPMVSARRFYNRITRDGIMVTVQDDDAGTEDSIYGVFIENAATSFGYARTYCAMLRMKDIPCELVHANYLGQNHYLCLATLEGTDYYIDPARMLMDGDSEIFLLTDEDLWHYGYDIIE